MKAKFINEFHQTGDPLGSLDLGQKIKLDEIAESIKNEFDELDYNIIPDYKNFAIQFNLKYNIPKEIVTKECFRLMDNGYMHAKGVDLRCEYYFMYFSAYINVMKNKIDITCNLTHEDERYSNYEPNNCVKYCNYIKTIKEKILPNDDIGMLLISIFEDLNYVENMEKMWKKLRSYYN